VKTGYCSAGYRHKQDRKHISHLLIPESGIYRKIHRRMSHCQPHHCTNDHARKHKGRHVVSGLHQKPHGEHSGHKDISKCQIRPCFLSCCQRKCHTDGKSRCRTGQADSCFFPSRQVKLLLDQSEYHGKYDKQQGNGAGRTIGLRRR